MRDDIKILVERLKEQYRPELIMIFGSAARGDFDQESDLDIVVIKKTKKRPLQRRMEVRKVLTTDLPLDVFVYTPAEFDALCKSGSAFAKTLLSEGKIVFKRSKHVRAY